MHGYDQSEQEVDDFTNSISVSGTLVLGESLEEGADSSAEVGKGGTQTG